MSWIEPWESIEAVALGDARSLAPLRRGSLFRSSEDHSLSDHLSV